MPSKSITGRLACHPSGYGFVTPDENPEEGDIFISSRRLGQALDGDRVRVRLLPRRRNRRRGRQAREGEVLSVLERGRETIVGRIERLRGEWCLSPLDPRYHGWVRLGDLPEGRMAEGKIAAAALLGEPGEGRAPFGRLLEILGEPGDPETQVRVICYQEEIRTAFPEGVLEEVEALSELPLQPAGRRDLRSLVAVTIDGETARDFDDAVSAAVLQGGRYRLWVHIADVSAYVREGSLLDREAWLRGTSVYFPDRAVPMLPERLSNDLCSLLPGRDRLTVSVRMEFDSAGTMVSAGFFPSIIRSRERMTYAQVEAILEQKDPGLQERYGAVLPLLESLKGLCGILMARREARGSIDFDLPEPVVRFGPQGEVRDILPSQRWLAHRMIEEAMLAANEAVAAFLEERGRAFLYRIHEEPDPLKVEEFQRVATALGHGLQSEEGGRVGSRSFQKLARRVAERPEGRFLCYLMLRSFQQACYSEVNLGHFGLASPCYTHFTSPIRRYPDLTVHRVLKACLAKEKSDPPPDLAETARHASQREQAAARAEREMVRWWMARFMRERLGEEFDAYIAGIRPRGFFVELKDHFVEGFVPVELLVDDFYIFNPERCTLRGETRGRIYRIGDSLRVRVERVDTFRGRVECSPVS